MYYILYLDWYIQLFYSTGEPEANLLHHRRVTRTCEECQLRGACEEAWIRGFVHGRTYR